MAKLVLWLPDGSIHDILLDKERLTIGRRPDNDVCLPYPAVSGEHAVVVTILADSFLEDLGSTNGTLVNGKPIAKHFLRENDLIDIGRQRLMYFSQDDVNAQPIPPDILRQQVRGLHDQVERARNEREERRKAGEAAAPKVLGGDPLLPDDELLAELEAASLPGMPASSEPPPSEHRPGLVMPARAVDSAASSPVAHEIPVQRPVRSTSTVAARLASTWTPDPMPGDGLAGKTAAGRDAQPAPAGASAVGEVPPQPEPAYGVRVLTGPNAGRHMGLTRGELSIGRVGTQVARVAAAGSAWRISRLEGAEPLEVNGVAVPDDGADLAPGDHFRVAGADLIFERL